MRHLIDAVVHHVYRAVAESHLKAIGMWAAEPHGWGSRSTNPGVSCIGTRHNPDLSGSAQRREVVIVADERGFVVPGRPTPVA